MDSFEKHIIKNKSLLNDSVPDKAGLWSKIAQDLEQPVPKVIPLWRKPFLQIAASILFLCSCFLGFNFYQQNNTAANNTVVNQELEDINFHYANLVSQQISLVKNHPKLSKQDKEEFLSFMVELDKESAQLKIEMQKNLNNERVLIAIVKNYKKRIELIESLLERINHSNEINEQNGYIL